MDFNPPEHPLRRYRRENAILIEDLARKANVAKSTISRIERREMAPSLNLVQRLVELTGGAVTANDFFKLEAAE